MVATSTLALTGGTSAQPEHNIINKAHFRMVPPVLGVL
jgi:hypothetical protein